jgi:hypothetical protein
MRSVRPAPLYSLWDIDTNVEGAMSDKILDVEWMRLRPGVTVLHDDGCTRRAKIVDHTDDCTTVVFDDGRREQHDDTDHALVVVRDA